VTKRLLFTVALLLLLVGWFGWLGPTQFGGPATYVTVSGFSMEPTLFDGDLAVLRASDDDYAPGDIVAYAYGEGLVIHRITGGDGEQGFLLQGDNRTRADTARPTAAAIAGELWFEVPGAGSWLLRLREPVNFGYFVMALAAIAGVGFGGSEFRRRRRRRWRRMMSTPTRQGDGPGDTGQTARGATERTAPSAGESQKRLDQAGRRALAWMGNWRPSMPPTSSLLIGTVALTGIVLVLFGAVAFSAFRQPTASSEYRESLRYEQSAWLDYEVAMERTALYPGGVFEPEGEPLAATAFDGPGGSAVADSFATASAREIELELNYSLGVLAGAAADEGADLSGTVSALLEIRAGRDGWTQQRPLIAKTSFSGPDLVVRGEIDLRTLATLISRIEEETGIQPTEYQLRILPRVEIAGELNGQVVRESLAPVFTFRYRRTQMSSTARLVRDEERGIGATVTRLEHGSFVGIKMTVSELRSLAVWGAASALLVGAVTGALLYFGVGVDEDTQIRNRYRSRLVAVESPGPGSMRETIRVASIHDLARVADRDGSLILTETRPGGAGGRRYFVPNGDEMYEYESQAPRQAPRPATAEVR
jgi:signal peptidase I